MAETIWTGLQALFGSGADPDDLGAGAMALRTAVIYALTLVLVRLSSRRLLAKPSAFDVIVAIMLGSIMSRAINGSAPLVPTLAAGAVLRWSDVAVDAAVPAVRLRREMEDVFGRAERHAA